MALGLKKHPLPASSVLSAGEGELPGEMALFQARLAAAQGWSQAECSQHPHILQSQGHAQPLLRVKAGRQAGSQEDTRKLSFPRGRG